MVRLNDHSPYADAQVSTILDESTWEAVRRRVERVIDLENDDTVGMYPFGDAPVREIDDPARDYRIRLTSLADADDARTIVLVAVVRNERLPTERELRARYGFTGREAEVALLLAQRRTNREIAQELCVTEHTARRHTERVLAKLGLDSRTDVEAAILGG